MARETAKTAPKGRLLLVHDGELPEIAPLFEALGVPFVECCGAMSAEQRASHWDLVVATPRRILELGFSPEDSGTQVIAVLDQESRTLRNSLKRSGIGKMVRRPVHPAAMRALVLHALYAGPEKRRSPRVSIGAPVKVKAGWRARPAILTDLSIGGCRLLSDALIERGHSFTLSIPASVSGDKSYSVKARSLESERSNAQGSGDIIITARFENLSAGQLRKIRATVELHSSGPARMAGSSNPPAAIPNRLPQPSIEPERRESERRVLHQPVVALDDEAARILMGHDLSSGGMRVEPTPHIAVGMELRLAVHVHDRNKPLVLRAKVHRDDADRGMVLRFCQLEPEPLRYLNELMDRLPMIEGSGSDSGALVTEILTTA